MPQTEVSPLGSLSLLQKVEAVREWVESGIASTLDEDPSGFILGVASVGVLAVLDEVAEALRDSR